MNRFFNFVLVKLDYKQSIVFLRDRKASTEIASCALHLVIGNNFHPHLHVYCLLALLSLRKILETARSLKFIEDHFLNIVVQSIF